MADAKAGPFGEVEGDYSVVKVQLAGGAAEEKPKRPTKGTQLVWGGTGASSPWGHLAALIEKAGGSVSYTYLHAADLKEPLVVAADEQQEEQAEEEKPEPKKADAKQDEPKHNTGGAQGHGPLYQNGLDFDYGGHTARVWAHPHCFFNGPRPLVIALHGINARNRQPHPPLNEHAVHAGKLVEKLIDDGKVTPLLIAAPTEFSNQPWHDFDIARFVAAVEKALEAQSVQIDHDQVSVVGHSGAGGYPGRGMNKIADQGGAFDGHKLKVFGLADTCITSDNAKHYRDGLKDNDTTVVYALHKGTGGWPGYSGSQTFAKALGAESVGKPTEPAEDPLDVDDHVYDNGKKPERISIRIKIARLSSHHKEWQATGGYHSTNAHEDMVPMWFWWAMPRFYPAVEEDQRVGLEVHEQPVPEPEEEKPLVTGGEWADVPPVAKIWSAPGVDPKPNNLAIFAPPSGLYWPVRNPKSHYGRAVSYVGVDNHGYGAGKGSSGRHFLADRPAGGHERFHAGIDVYGDHHDIIVACEAGVVVNAYPFYPYPHPLVWCLIVQHDSGVVINYGEVDPASLKKYGMKPGVRVQPGQPIAEVGRMVSDSMLHFETYPSGTKKNISVKQAKAESLLPGIYNPTQYLLALATKGK